MPIKIPKGFQRRKSSGNALDEAQPSEPSFKVYTRPHSSGRAVDMALAAEKPFPAGRNSYEQEDDDLFTVLRPDAINRGSGGTHNSHSTAPYDSGASSTRLSSSSTNPSSIDTRSDKISQPTTQTSLSDAPVPPPHQQRQGGFLRNAGRTFSFGVKSKPPELAEQPPVPPIPAVPAVPASKPRFSFSTGRERAMTTSSVSTATPPRLLESDLPLDNNDSDGFGNMFDGIGSKSREPSPIRLVPTETSTAPTRHQLRPDVAYPSRAAPPQPIIVNRSDQVEASPYSCTSENSRDGLMNTPSPANTVTQNSPQISTIRNIPMASRDGPPQYMDANADDNLFSNTANRSRAYSRTARSTAAPPSSFNPPNRFNSRSNSTATSSLAQASPIMENEDSSFDPSLLASAQLATKYQESKSPTASSHTKVMTPAQFERYRQQQEERHRMNKVFQNQKPDSEESDDNYDDEDEDDEAERDRNAAKQRKKQEAHLAVYRQTMMKITGEGPVPNANATPLPNPSNPTSGQPAATQSTSDLNNHLVSLNFDNKSPARSSDDDEDDDVPLGILAAHGFPNKNKPPNRLASSSSNSNLRSVAQSQQPGASSVAGESVKRGSLPVFARHLPEDPYYGAGLVNPANRESMAMHSSNNLSVPSGASTAHPHHPAGLVGVIAGEERARAMRRGSPNATTGTFDLPPSMPMHPGMPRSQTTGSMPNLLMPPMPGMGPMPGMPQMPGMMPQMPGMPPMPQMLSPGDHAQIQMSQQMTQMMQMQMQWMQQMQQMMTNQAPAPGMPSGMPPSIPPVNQALSPLQRPQSVPLQSHPGQEQRTMSTLNPSMAGWMNGVPSFQGNPASNYAPSMAPTERSNIGLASRYRPVSTAPQPEQPWEKRASTMTSTTFRPFSSLGGNPKQPAASVRKVPVSVDDEDDEQGWAEMKAKKDQKKKTWKLRKGQNVLQELYNESS